MGYFLAKLLNQTPDQCIAIAVESIAQNLCMKFAILFQLFTLLIQQIFSITFSPRHNTPSAGTMHVPMPKTARTNE